MPEAVHTVFARSLYDGVSSEPLADQLVTINDGRITAVEALGQDQAPPPGVTSAEIAAPGFIDLQINGAADTQFNEEPTLEAIARIAAGARKGGTAHVLPTFITAPDREFERAIAAVNEAIDEGVAGVLGVHLEGPFLSPDRPGIHPPQFIRTMTGADVETTKTARGSVLVTLAPETQEHELIRHLATHGVRVFCGHSNATADQMAAAIEAGVSGVTHLFNAQSQITGREPGVVGSALVHPELSAGIIADGFHVHPQNMAMAAALMGDRLFLVTDAMKTLAGTVSAFDLYGTPVKLAEGCLRGPEGTLAGAHLAMDQAVRNAVSMMGVTRSTALKMASTNVASALGIADELGHLAPGYRASLTLLDADLNATGVIVDGLAY